MKIIIRRSLFVCFSLILSFAGIAQNINFKRYSIEQGIKHPTVYTINQDKTGFIWLGTGAGVCRFDGLRFSTPQSGDSVSKTYVNASFRDKAGNVWFGFDDGGIYCYKNNKLVKVYENKEFSSVINAFAQDEKSNILAVSQNAGFFYIEKEKVVHIKNGIEAKLFYSVYHLYGAVYLLGTSDGLWVCELNLAKETVLFLSKISQVPSSRIQCIIPIANENGFWIGTDDSGVYKLKKEKSTSYSAVQIGTEFGIAGSNVQHVLEDNSRNLWISTFGEGVHKLNYDPAVKKYASHINYNESNGMGDNYIKCAFLDMEQNIWFGTYSNGISGIIDEAFVFYNFKLEGYDNDIQSVASNKKHFWIGSRNFLNKIDATTGKVEKSFSSKNGFQAEDIITLQFSDENTLWIGTRKNGVLKMDVRTEMVSKFFNSANSLENKINDLAFAKDKIFIATNGGVFAKHLTSGKIDHFSTNTGLPHNKVNAFFVDNDENVWIATKSNGVLSLTTDKQFKIDNLGELEFTDIVSDNEGNLWASTYGEGIFVFKNDTLIHLNENNGLPTAYVYSLVRDNSGNIWSGHRLSICKINTKTFNKVSYSTEIGIIGDCNPNASDISEDNVLRFGTSNGLVQYNNSGNVQSLAAPLVNLISVKVSDVETDFSGPIELPSGTYRLRFEFVGLSFRAPAAVKYQYILEGWETEWSDITENTVAYYPRVEDGNFRFLVRAYNAEGVYSEQPIALHLTVKPPLWKRWWFIGLVIVALFGLIYAYIKYRERKQILFQKYLQKLLDERTREVVEQKEEIESKNRDITDSITYAQRIQTSILPSIKRLHDTFSGCFIFYSPRDIVSGDFYWFDRISDSKFVIVCGDSTGHGVPGALMSMIGTTLIKDICNRPDVVSPSNILEKLDEEMRLTLNQNLEAEKSCDGMDMIACEIDTQNYIVKVASAMRPIIIYQNGVQIYVAGSKSSIGGNEMALEIKDFENQEFQLSKGDLIYMFSDGYPDQFGGPMGKKFKMVRLRNLLRDIHELPMEEQYHHVKNTFNLWRDQLDQVDDVLFMGIRL